MRAFVLVLLVAASALAYPYVTVEQTARSDANAILREDNGRLINGGIIARLLLIVDPADFNIYTNSLEEVLKDMADARDSHAQTIALVKTIALLGTLSSGYPGDSCLASIAINDYAAGGTAASYRRVLADFIKFIVEISSNGNSRRFSSGPSGGCVGDGTIYNFEGAWDRLLDSVSPHSLPILNEAYCYAKRLYNANSILSNDIAAAITAGAAVADEGVDLGPLANFARAVVYGGNVPAAAALAIQSIVS